MLLRALKTLINTWKYYDYSSREKSRPPRKIKASEKKGEEGQVNRQWQLTLERQVKKERIVLE